jgi:membrane protease YdiL (CAAX protease family)
MTMKRDIPLTGTWEREGKNPLIASFILIFVVGGLYSFIPSIIVNIYIGIDGALGGFRFTDDTLDFIELYKSFYHRYKYVILTLTSVFQYGFFFIIPILVIKKWHTTRIGAYVQSDHLHVPALILSLCGVIFIIPLVDSISRFFYYLFPVFEKLSEISLPLFKAQHPPELIFTFFVLSFTPALCEEVLFRGYFQRTLQRKLSFPWHFIISGGIFALFHQQPLGLPALFLIGAFLGFIYYCSASIYTSIAVHFLYNFIIILSVNLETLPAFLVTENGHYHIPIVIISFILFALVAIAIYLTRSKDITDRFIPAGSEEIIESV